jgi:hypothetical protein
MFRRIFMRCALLFAALFLAGGDISPIADSNGSVESPPSLLVDRGRAATGDVVPLALPACDVSAMG